MEKGSDAPADFQSGRGFPKGLRSDVKKEIHTIEKGVFPKGFLVLSKKVPEKSSDTLHKRQKKILEEFQEDKKRIFPKIFAHIFSIFSK